MTRRLLLVILIVLLFAFIVGLLPPRHKHLHAAPIPPTGSRATAESIHAVPSEEATVRNNPVVKGGVDIPKILEMIKKGEYQDVDGETLQPIITKEDMEVFVQYRRNENIYWSVKKIKILKGTLMFCDEAAMESPLGGACILARCGNEISWGPEMPVEIPLSPLTGWVSDVPAPLDTPTSFIFSPGSPDSPPPSSEIPPESIFPGGGNCCGGGSPGGGSPGGPPVVSTPEPSSISMVIVGVLIFGLWRIL